MFSGFVKLPKERVWFCNDIQKSINPLNNSQYQSNIWLNVLNISKCNVFIYFVFDWLVMWHLQWRPDAQGVLRHRAPPRSSTPDPGRTHGRRRPCPQLHVSTLPLDTTTLKTGFLEAFNIYVYYYFIIVFCFISGFSSYKCRHIIIYVK